MKNLIKLLILVSVNISICWGMTIKTDVKPVKVLPSLQALCAGCIIQHDLMSLWPSDVLDVLPSILTTEAQDSIITGLPSFCERIGMLYKIPGTKYEYRQKWVTTLLPESAIVICAHSTIKPSLDGKEPMSELLQQEITKIITNTVNDFIARDGDITLTKKEILKKRNFTMNECLWLYSFYASAVAFADTIALDECDDSLKENKIVFDSDIKEILMNQSKKLQQIQPKYGWDPSKLGKKSRTRSKSH